ncbi:MAG: rhomboid family intramembrane serine protease [Alphaproteobacteria bacterium]|nr:rhomboid family intramembrane serine protease [Alphaproteobacteria bacterium]
MTEKKNGKSNGSGADEEKIVRFPTLAERDRMAREEREAEKRALKNARIKRAANDVPFMNLSKITPFVKFLIAAFLLVHIPVFLFLGYPARHEAFFYLGFVPGRFTGVFGPMPWYAPLNFISYVFIHGSWMHLVFNTVMAMAMGILFERSYSTRTTVIFFFACAILGAGLHLALNPFSTAPVIGASGGISGFFAAAILMLGERGQMGAIGKRGPWPILGFWLLFMLVVGFLSGEDTAWQAHVGGFVAGAGLYHLLRTGRIRF